MRLYRNVLAEAEDAFFAVFDCYTVRDLTGGIRELLAVLRAEPP
ncbi:MAG: hypothetical protein OXG51_04740 [Gammaproteobacteria bacterium]|nr:hypothetical protein [Gammaproteobacteria bacterium]